MAMTQVVSMRLREEQVERLRRMARRLGRSVAETGALLTEEGLRRSEFAFIDFRDSPAGRQAYIQGSTLAVWEVLLLVRSYKEDATAVAKHLQWPDSKVQAAINYAEAFSEEIEQALSENSASDFRALQRMLPQAQKLGSRHLRKSRDAQTASR